MRVASGQTATPPADVAGFFGVPHLQAAYYAADSQGTARSPTFSGAHLGSGMVELVSRCRTVKWKKQRKDDKKS